jgi:hypothetical protein
MDMTQRWSGGAAAAIGLLLFAASVRFGTFTAWGTDASSYVEAGRRWAAGEVFAPSPLPLTLPAAFDGSTASPVGFRPGPAAGTDVSIYPLGYPLLVAAAVAVGGATAAYLVVPACAAILVWSTYAVGAAAAGPTAGLFASLAVAASPVTLVSAVQPMSDVPAAALWVLAWALSVRPGVASASAAGSAVALATAIRPNLVLLAVVPAVMVLTRARASEPRRRFAPVLAFAGAAACGPALVLWSQHALYGSAFTPGYPDADHFYALTHVWPNLSWYPALLAAVHSPWIFAGVAALPAAVWLRRRVSDRLDLPVAWSALAMALMCLAAYLPFLPYRDPLYARFMLPALAALSVLAMAAPPVLAAAVGASPRWAAAASMVLLWLTAADASLLRYAAALGDAQRRASLMGEYLDSALPANAVVLAAEHSGVVAHYTRRPVVRFDLLHDLDSAVVDLRARSYAPVLVLDELVGVEQFRRRFPASVLARLDWPPRARAIDTVSSLACYDLRDPAGPPAAPEPVDVVRVAGGGEKQKP